VLIWWDTLLVLDLGIDILNGIAAFNFKGDGLADFCWQTTGRWPHLKRLCITSRRIPPFILSFVFEGGSHTRLLLRQLLEKLLPSTQKLETLLMQSSFLD